MPLAGKSEKRLKMELDSRRPGPVRICHWGYFRRLTKDLSKRNSSTSTPMGSIYQCLLICAGSGYYYWIWEYHSENCWWPRFLYYFWRDWNPIHDHSLGPMWKNICQFLLNNLYQDIWKEICGAVFCSSKPKHAKKGLR